MTSATTKLSLAVLAALVVSVMAVSPAAADSSLDEELEEYWSTEREMETIQDRLFERENRIEVGLFAGLMTSEPFFHYYPVGLKGTYHISNQFGVEVGGSFMDTGLTTQHTELTEFLVEDRGEAGFDTAADTADRYLWRANAMAMWSPFYGKIAALQQKLLHFDLNFGAGLGAVGVERPEVDREGAYTTATPELILGTGAHFYIDQSFVLRFDGRGYLNRGAELPTNQDSFFKQLRFPVEFQLGISYLF